MNAPEKTHDDPAAKLNDAKEQAAQTVDTTEELVRQSKEKFVANLQSQLDDFDRQAQTLKEQSTQLTEDARANWQESWETLQRDREKLAGKVEEIKASGDRAWIDLRDGMTTAWSEMQTSFERAASQLRSRS